MRNQIVLVDGALECGRHAVAEHVARALRAQLFVGSLKTQPWEYVQAMQPALDGLKPVVIEYSWRTSIIRKKLGLAGGVPSTYCRMLTRLALTRDAHSVICLSDLRTYMTCVARAHKTHHVEGLINAALIHEAWRSLKPDITTYLVNHPQDETVHMAMDWSDSLHEYGPGAGNWRFGNILVVGGKHGASAQPYRLELNAPFVSMSGVGCSEWLADHLDEHHINESHLYWINSRDRDGEPTDAEFEARLEPTNVIALGRNAGEWCNNHGIEAVHIEHPQYHKRFMSTEPYALGPLLKRLINSKEE